MVNIKGLDKTKVLMALWKHSHTRLSFLAERPLLSVKAESMINDLKKRNQKLCFDYVNGRVIKCDITGDEFDPRLYDRDCGEGAAQRAIDSIRRR